MKLVLAGSPQLALSTFEALIEAFDVVAIITQPDKPVGRNKVLTATPVALLARQRQIKLFKPHRINEIYDELSALDYDLLITFAYGQLIPERILRLGKYPALNLHASLLPKYRGASPIHAAVLQGESEIGISLMQMVRELDAGPVLFQAQAPLDFLATSGEAMVIIEQLASTHIVPWLNIVFSHQVAAQPQAGTPTFCTKLTDAAALIAPSFSRAKALRYIQAFNPDPVAHAQISGQRVKIWAASLARVKQAPVLMCSDGALYLIDYQFASRKRIKLASLPLL